MRLRFVQSCHFGKSEMTNFNEIIAKHPEFAANGPYRLKGEDVVLLVSLSANQLVFLYGFDQFGKLTVLRSTRFRLKNNSTWDPMMLADYAKSVGIPLQGLQTYEAHIKKLMKGQS